MTDLKVICKNSRNSIRLVKGAIYDVDRLYINKFNNETRVYIRKLGDFSAIYFTLLNGENLNNITPFSNIKIVDSNKSYKNKFVKCFYSNDSKIKENEIYLVENQLKDGLYLKFKLKGINKYYKHYMFSEVDEKEVRNLKINNIKEDGSFENNSKKRKFTLYSEKEKITILLDIMGRSLKDISISSGINNYDNFYNTLKDLMTKRSKKYTILEEEIDNFLEMNKNLLINFIK